MSATCEAHMAAQLAAVALSVGMVSIMTVQIFLDTQDDFG